MPNIGLETYLVPLVLIAVLGGLLFFVRRRAGLSALGGGQRLRVVDAKALGQRERAMIVCVDDREFLLVTTPGGVALTKLEAVS